MGIGLKKNIFYNHLIPQKLFPVFFFVAYIN